MASWDDAIAQNQRMSNSNGGELFVRLKDDGDSVVLAILGDPEPRKVVWDGSRMVDYDHDLHAGEKPKTRWLLNAFDIGAKSLKILEAGPQLFRSIAAVREKFAFSDWAFEVKRSGRAGDTKTTYTVLPDKQLDAGQKAYLKKVQLHDLSQYAGAKSEPTHLTASSTVEAMTAAAAQEFGEDDIPFAVNVIEYGDPLALEKKWNLARLR